MPESAKVAPMGEPVARQATGYWVRLPGHLAGGGLAHQRTRDLEDVGDLLLGELGAGHQPALDDGVGDRSDDPVRRVAGLRRVAAPRGGDCTLDDTEVGAAARHRGMATGG